MGLSKKEQEEFLKFSNTAPGPGGGNLSDEEKNEFSKLKTSLTPSTAGQAPVPTGDAGPRRGPVTMQDVVNVGKSVGRGVATLGKTLAEPEVALPTAGAVIPAALGQPQFSPLGAGIGSVAATTINVVPDILKHGEPDDPRIKMAEDMAMNVPVVGKIILANRLGRGVQSDPSFFPPLTEEEKNLVKEGMPSLARMSQMFRGKGGDILKEYGKNTIVDVGLEWGALKIAQGVSRAKRGGFFKIAEEAAEAQDILRPLGGSLNMAQLTESSILDTADRFARAGAKSGQIMRNFDVGTQTTIAKGMEDLADLMAVKVGRKLSREELAGILQGGFDIGQTARKAIERNLYDEVFDLAAKENARIPTQAIKRARADILLELQQKRGIIPEGSEQVVSYIKKNLEGLPPTLDFESAHGIRSAFKTIASEAEKPSAKRFAMKMVNAMNNGFDSTLTAGGISEELTRSLKRADKFFKSDMRVFQDDFVARLFIENKKAPEMVGQAIYKNGNVQQVKKTMLALRRAERMAKYATKKGYLDEQAVTAAKNFKAKDAVQAMREGYNNAMMNKHFIASQESAIRGVRQELRGFMNWDTMLQDLSKDTTRETIETLYSKEHYRRLVDLAKTGQFAAAKSPGSANALGFLQTHAFAQVPRAAGGAVTGEGMGKIGQAIVGVTSVLQIPQTMAKVMTNEAAIKWATKGLADMAKGTKIAIQSGLSSMARAAREITVNVGDRINPFTQPIVYPTEEQQ